VIRTAEVDGLLLTMPAGWWVWKYDDSAFHRNQFQSFAKGSKAVDAVALADDGTLWLIEVKDYRRHRRTKPGSVFDETAGKVRSTLAGLAAARVNANDTGERDLAVLAMTCGQIRVALQLIQPSRPSKLFPRVVDPCDAQLQLKRVVRAVDAHPVCAASALGDARLPWETVNLHAP
jgi:hypothetical protein